MTRPSPSRQPAIQAPSALRTLPSAFTATTAHAVFTFASGEVEADYDTFAILATEAMQGAVVRAVEQAEGAYGLPAARDLVSC